MTTPQHVVLGAGTLGITIAEQLAAAGEPVRLVTRSGRNPGITGIETAAADLTDPAAVRAVAAGARVAYFASQPAYTDWPKGFPPLAEGVLGGLAGRGRAWRSSTTCTCTVRPTGGRSPRTSRTRPPRGDRHLVARPPRRGTGRVTAAADAATWRSRRAG